MLTDHRLARLSVVALTTAALLSMVLAPPLSASTHDRFPSDDPDPRVGTPDDPEFDCSEPDDEDEASCATIYDEQYELFGFAPESTASTATYVEGPRAGEAMVSGVSADLAWKRTIGDPSVVVAIIDTGINWSDEDVRTKVWLNVGELPVPSGATTHDADGDGSVTVEDWADDPRVGDVNDNGVIDGQDLIGAFSDGTDADGNGYVDDIAGWDFFDNDNDPSDDSSYSSSRNHGTGRAEDAAQRTHDARNEAGVCPRCQVMMLRLWDTFVAPGDQYAMATVYAADNGAAVQEVALGVVQNTRSAREATDYARRKGMALMQVSSDLNTASHNYPTNYVGTTFVNGCVPDAYGLGAEIPGLSDVLDAVGIADSQVPVTTYFRQSNLTQHGAHAAICMMGDTGSFATGQAAGAAGLLVSLGRELADSIGGELSSNEVRQLLTMTAEDVTPGNTGALPFPDPSQVGWDERFGYGRADLDAATAALQEGRIPPEAQIESPPWWHMLDPTADGSVPIVGSVDAARSSSFTYRLEWATGVEPPDDGFEVFAQGEGTAAIDGVLGELPLDDVADALPGSREGVPPSTPNDYVVTIRLVVEDADGIRGEDRKAYHVFHDPTLMPGWPRFADTGGETSMVLYDLDADGTLEIIDADSSGALHVLQPDGSPWPGFNDGQPWRLPPLTTAHLDAPGFASGAVTAPTGGFRTPAVADVDGDLWPEIVAAGTDGRIWALEVDGTLSPGFPVSVDPRLAADPTREDHRKQGFLAAPVIADLDGDGAREIIAGALDGHIYVWDGHGRLRDGFPIRLADPAVEEFYGGELMATPAVGDLDGDGDLEIVSGSSEVYPMSTDAAVPSPSPGGLVGAVQGLATNVLAGALGGSSRVYALHDDGSYVDGWPVEINGVLPDVLPFIGPQHATAVADLDGDGHDEVVASITTSATHVFNGDGSQRTVLANTLPAAQLTDLLEDVASDPSGIVTDPAAALGAADVTEILNLFEYPVVGDLDADGSLEVVSGGITALLAINLVTAGLNLPFSHVMQAWDPATAQYEIGYPTTTEDYQLLSTPAIADVDGDGRRDITFGTGLYLLNAYGDAGAQAEGFPKLTGGWIFAVPSIGDVDGDGDLEAAVGTREGYRFLWDLPGAATADSNSEWWTEAHDECHTNRHGTDCRPPSFDGLPTRDGDVIAVPGAGDDWLVGTAERIEVRTEGSPAALATLPPEGGEVRLAELRGGPARVLVVAFDDAGNASAPVRVAGDHVTAGGPSPRPLATTGGGGSLALVGALLAAVAFAARRQRAGGPRAARTIRGR